MRWSILGVLLSVAVHLGVGVSIASLPKDVVRKHSLVSVVDKKKKKDEKKEDEKPKDEPPPPPPPKQEPRARGPRPKAPENTPPPPAANAPPPSAAHAALAALPNLGISMAGGPGAGGVGIAVPPPAGRRRGPCGGPAARATEERPKTTAKAKDDCAEPDAVKPKMIVAIAQDRIIAAAQAAGGIEGRIRLELLVDENGNVTAVKVMSGLGGAIDEAALSAAKRVKVTASTRCGRPVAGRLVVAITVRNPD